ncbi:hypothetical protein JQS43_15425 [Natronosporangium hydrolyticum]|uniref:Uncharacterized protein n=1 Tax=Natronosporangium hydrolyticum TaxID=2811111 RepID=A0A895YH60_9ACTN|nr:hypothetical protein [Natronosporangium hydrolyticum]QSB13038.1 hypothetical protein JQS43_15425 [Natronosporangium hydrolyticum]
MVGYSEELAEDGLVYLASCFPPPPQRTEQGDAESPAELGHWSSGPFGGEQDPDAAQWDGIGELVVLEEAPDFDDPEPGLLDVWAEAVAQLEMHGPTIATAPPSHGGLVRLPVWLWTEETDLTWPEPLEAVAEGGPWLVEAWAEPQQISWDMGEGRPPAVCDGPGVAWESGMDFLSPPADACRYTYQRSSRQESGGAFRMVAMTTWRVWWHINGEFDNDVLIEVGNSGEYEVYEIQVLTGG